MAFDCVVQYVCVSKASAVPGVTSKCLMLLNMAIKHSHIRIIQYIILHI